MLTNRVLPVFGRTCDMRGAPLLVLVVACAGARTPAEPDAGAEPDDASTCDGLPCDAIYVAISGADSGVGSKESPLKTIAAAIKAANAASPKKAVFVGAGA